MRSCQSVIRTRQHPRWWRSTADPWRSNPPPRRHRTCLACPRCQRDREGLDAGWLLSAWDWFMRVRARWTERGRHNRSAQRARVCREVPARHDGGGLAEAGNWPACVMVGGGAHNRNKQCIRRTTRACVAAQRAEAAAHPRQRWAEGLQTPPSGASINGTPLIPKSPAVLFCMPSSMIVKPSGTAGGLYLLRDHHYAG
jgi:hypothetical protein